MNETIIQVGNDETLRWQVSAGDHILWVRWKDIFSSKSEVGILDFWEIRAGDAVAITNRIQDLPPWHSGYLEARFWIVSEPASHQGSV